MTVVPEDVYRRYLPQTRLRDPMRVLNGPNQEQLQFLGGMNTEIGYQEKKLCTDIYVVRGLGEPLLSTETSEALAVVKRLFEITAKVSQVSESSVKALQEFPKLLQGLGCVKMPYRIRLKREAVPFALSTPRRVPLPLMGTIKKEVEHMVAQGVIVPVDEPT